MVAPKIVSSDAVEPHTSLKPPLMLAVLGAMQLGHGTVKEVVQAAKQVAAADWQPTSDVVVACLRDAIETGLIRDVSDGHGDDLRRLQMTEAGTQRLCEIVHASSPVAGPIGRACVAMRLCVLGTLLPHARMGCVASLRRDYEHELADLRRRCSRCPSRNPFVRIWMDHEIGRIEWELDWLDRFLDEVGGREAIA